MDGRRKLNNFFEAADRDFFIPRGLFCLVITWNPAIDDPYVTCNMNQTIDTSMTMGGGRKIENLKHKFQKSNAESSAIPEFAPPEFPTLDKMHINPERKKRDTMKDKAKRKIEFAAGYRDKRAQARFNAEEPDCALNQGPEPEFTSRYPDPNHPASEGSPIALLSGGRVTEKQIFKYTATGFAYNKGKKAYAKHKKKRASRETLGNGVYPETESSSRSDGELKPKEGMSETVNEIANRLKKKVVYLIIVNMPSEEELQQARQMLEP
ncbi:hypothetical protein PHISCL_00799 [Aspergillus sclerotialis]|uniref:Uncharacterized protein n=1 Tax=Aspergillus sclerotialis TaxID=2070753 RepID=A0A3A2ZZT1_9EURO|nr:hypothetical protein PHISCL_00799 [Aspergillus sclerotialis]